MYPGCVAREYAIKSISEKRYIVKGKCNQFKANNNVHIFLVTKMFHH